MTLTLGFTRTFTAAWCLSLAGGFVACGGDDDPGTPPPPPPVVSALTYNGGLAPGFVEATAARSPETIAALAEIEAGIVCVQEFWLPGDVSALVEATSETLPNSWFIDNLPGDVGDVPCMAGDTDDLLTCVEANGCDMVCPDQLVSCGLMNCAVELALVPSNCQSCIQANVGNPLDDILTACESPAISYTYGGAFGIGLLSEYEATAEDELVFESTIVRRGVLYAELDTPLGPVHTFCTHLNADLTDVMYTGPFGSWAEEQRAQIDAMLAFVEEKAGPDGQVLMLGDFNTGPAGTGYEAEVPNNYDHLISTGGLGNPYVTTPGHSCTFCGDNPIVAKDDSTDVKNAVIDHVLIRGFTGGTGDAKRVLDAGLEVENCGETISSALSDHYGVQLTITGE